jgi:hypothetical protein
MKGEVRDRVPYNYTKKKLLKNFKMCVVLVDKFRGNTLLNEIHRKDFSSKKGTVEMRGMLPLYKKRNDRRSMES